MSAGRFVLGLLGCVLSLGIAQGARAEDWVPSGRSVEGSFQTDLDTLSRKGDVVQSWMRETLAQPANDQTTGKTFVLAITQRYDDCENHRVGFGNYVRRDAAGGVVSSGVAPGGWTVLVPGSVGASIQNVTCAATRPPSDKPLWDHLNDGQWTSLGASADKKYVLYIALDRVLKIDANRALVLSRSDMTEPQFVDGLPIRYTLTANVVDCSNNKMATFGADFYVSPTIRVKSVRADPQSLQFDNVAPGSFAFNSISKVCASAVAVKSTAPAAPNAQSLTTGTAWAITKGYLVTADHVVTGAKRIGVYGNGEHLGDAIVVAADPANDLAILKPINWHGGKLSALRISARSAALGRGVFTLGYPAPGELGQRIKMTAGEVSSTAGYQDDARFIQISTPIQAGNSGGPVIGWDGGVIGVVDAKLVRFEEQPQSAPPEMVNYAVKSSYVRPLMDDLPDLANYVSIKSGPKADELISQARNAVFLLVAEP